MRIHATPSDFSRFYSSPVYSPTLTVLRVGFDVILTVTDGNVAAREPGVRPLAQQPHLTPRGKPSPRTLIMWSPTPVADSSRRLLYALQSKIRFFDTSR